jgi:tRNA(Ile)-lysidine synthetase-like protein
MLYSEVKDKKNKIFLEKINKRVGKTINYYNLIDENDIVLIALSGGKDSMVMLDALSWRLKNLPIKYKLIAVHVKLAGLSYQINEEELEKFCSNRNVELIIKTEEVDITKSNKTPCFICSHTRRKILFSLADEMNCTKLAFGHHKDDAVETLLMNMLYHSNISSIPAKVKMFNGKFELIRPLINIRDNETKQYSEILKYAKMKKLCYYEDITKRNSVAKLMKDIEQLYPQGINSMFKAMSNIDTEYLP